MRHERARSVRVLAMDVDGVLTRGDVVYSDAGTETKVFNIRDGLGISLAHNGGLVTAIVSGRTSAAVEKRARELGVGYLYQGCRDKAAGMRQLCAESGVCREETAFIGDDLNDIPAFAECGWKIAVSSASEDLKARADHVTELPGGHGAVREVIELILKAQGKWTSAVEQYLRRLEQSECQT